MSANNKSPSTSTSRNNSAPTATTIPTITRDNLKKPNWSQLLKTWSLSYHQRVRIAFLEFADDGEDEFIIQNFINKANSIIPYLGIVQQTKMTMFEVMDLFRVFDRSGDGNVSIDEFVTGICVQIRLNICNNNELLEKVASEIDKLFSSDRVAASKFLEASMDNPSVIEEILPEYFKIFKFFDSYIRPKLKTYFQILESKQQSSLTGLEIIYDCLKTGIFKLESQLLSYYHISYFVLKDVINSSSERSGNIEEQRGIEWGGIQQKTDIRHSKNRVLWNIQQSIVVKSKDMNHPVSLPDDTESVMDEAERFKFHNQKVINPVLQLPSNLSHRDDLAKKITKLFQDIGYDGTDASKQSSINKSKKNEKVKGFNEENVKGFLDILTDVSHYSKHIIENLDDSQLFLIQLAYRIIINFFHLQCLKTFNDEDEEDSDAAKDSIAFTTSLGRTLLPQKVASKNGSGGNSNSNNYHNNNSNRTNNNDEVINLNQNMDNLKTIDENLNSGNHNINDFLLAELLKTKQKLQKANMRLDIMESLDIEDNIVTIESDDDELTNIGDDISSNTNEGSKEDAMLYPNCTFEDILGELESFRGAINCRMSEKMAVGSLLQDDIIMMNGEHNLLKEIKHYSELIVENSSPRESRDRTIESFVDKDEKSHALSNQERQEFMRLQVQFQIMRAKVISLQADSKQLEALKQQNNALQNEVNELSLKLAGKTENENIFEGIDRKHHHLHDEDEHFDLSNVADGDDIRDRFKKLAWQLEEALIKNERFSKDNVRLNFHVKDSEMRIKNLLQEELDLNQQLSSAEDELNGCKVFIGNLLSQLEHSKSLQILQDSKNNTVAELKGEIVRRDAEIAILREEASLSRRYKQELVSAEKVIETLELKLSDLLRESEHGIAAIEHLDSYRDQVRDLTKINRDSALEIRRLETSLKSLNEFESSNKLLLRQNQEHRVQIEKIPGLLSEVARLRGSSRASMKALSEQDKLLSQLRNQLKALEKENIRIKINTRNNNDLNQSLKEANEEITRLMIVASEVSTLKAGAKNAEEEKKNMESQFKKMKKAVRQSILISKPPPPSTVVTDLSGNVDEIFSSNAESSENNNSSNDGGNSIINKLKKKGN